MWTIDMVVNLLMQGLDLSVVHIFMSLLQGSIAVSKTADVGAKPTGHVSMTKSWIAIICKRKLKRDIM